MKPRAMGMLVLGLGCGVALLAAAASLGAAQTMPRRIAFQIATGATGGPYFPIGELIAGIVSHPPGVERCARRDACGPDGLIATARTSNGAVANVLAVNSGQMDSGFAQADVVAQAVAGQGAFRKAGKQTHLRVIAALFPEDVQLVASTASHITKVADLRGRRVSLGPEGSGSLVTARAVLAAYRIPAWRIKSSFDSPDVAAHRLHDGGIDAFFFVGRAPAPPVASVLAQHDAVLVPIDGPGRDRLLKSVAMLSPDTIAAGVYPGTSPVETVSSRAVWIVNSAQPDTLVYGIARSLFDPANRDLLAQGGADAKQISLDRAAANLPAPLHPGAARFYREAGKLKAATQ